MINRREQLEHLRHAGPVAPGILNFDEYDIDQDSLFHELATLDKLCRIANDEGFEL